MKKFIFFLALIFMVGVSYVFAQNSIGQSIKLDKQIETPAAKDGWLTWCNDPLANVVGTGGIDFAIFHRFAVSDLASYAGQNITQIKYQPYTHTSQPTVFTSNPRLQIYVGGSFVDGVAVPGTLAVDYTVPTYTFNEDQTIDIPTPVLITGTQEVWVGVYYNATAGYPGCSTAGAGSSSFIEGKSNIFFIGGSYNEWGTSTEFFNPPSSYCWTHAAYVVAGNPGENCDPATNLNVTYAPDCNKATLTWNAPAKVANGVSSYTDISIRENAPQNVNSDHLKNVSPAEREMAQKMSEINIEPSSFVSETPSKEAKGTIVLSENFSTTTLPAGWLNLDVDGDTYKWQFTQTDNGCNILYPEGHNDTYCINSASYYNCVGALSPNNWLITPALSLGNSTQISWWVKTVDAAYSNDHYGVYISTTGTNPSDFSLLYEKTLSSSYANNWTKETITTTLGGTNCYIAFRHFNSNDVYIFCIDDVEVSTEGVIITDTKYNVYRNDVKIAGPITETTFDDTSFDSTLGYTWSVKVACAAGGESAPTSKTMDACNQQCDPVTIAIALVEAGMLVTWGDEKTVNVYKNEAIYASNVTGTSYLDATPAIDDCYKVEVICGAVNSPMSNIECYVGINDMGKPSFSIMPNPTTNDITITANSNVNMVEIVSFLGQTILSQPVSGNIIKLDVSNLTNGVYFVRIISDNGTSAQKFVKQ
jgi:hypothetical protein